MKINVAAILATMFIHALAAAEGAWSSYPPSNYYWHIAEFRTEYPR